jgi:heptosyltransferase-2
MKPSAPSAIVRRTHPPRLLIRAVNWIGDAVMTMPAIQRLRELEPAAHLTLAAPGKLHDLWRHNPYLNALITPDQLQPRQYDVALILPNSFRAAWECYRAQIPTRVGFAGHWRRALLTDVVPEPHAEEPVQETLHVAGKTFQRKTFPVLRHQAHRYLDLISYLGGNRDLCQPKIWLAPHEFSPLQKFLPNDQKPCLGINAGAEYGPAKRWPAHQFAAVIQQLADQLDCRFLLFGGPGDAAMTGEIARQVTECDLVNLAGKTSLLELCELLQHCRVLLTNDTGPMHLAAAVGTPLVAIFGSTSAELTGPLGPHVHLVNADVECTPCFLRECPIDFRCMNSITPAHVTATVLKAWHAAEENRGHK